MASQKGSSRIGVVAWPKRALALFVLILIVIYSVIFVTGDRQPIPKLGIDLQGGTRVTLVPQGETPTQEQLSQARNILENRVNGMGVSGASVVTDGNTLVITVPGEDTSQARALGQTSQLLFRPVEEPGNPNPAGLMTTMTDMANRWVEHGIITPEQANESLKTMNTAVAQQEALTPQVPQEGESPEEAAKKAQDAAAEKAKEAEASAPVVSASAPEPVDNSIEAAAQRAQVIEVLKEDRQSADPTTQVAAASLLQCEGTNDPMAGADDPAKPFVTCNPDTQQRYILAPAPLLNGQTDEATGTRLTGNEIDTSRPITGGQNPQTGQMEVSFSFKSSGGDEGGATWYKLTQDYLQRQVAVTLDSQVISAPVIQSPTPTGSATSITGSFTLSEAQELANNLKYGALPLSFAGENGERGGTATTIPASLGKASLKAGLIAGLVGLVLVSIFGLAYYRVFGFLAIFTLVASGSLVYGSLVLLGRWIGYSLDLAGIAGLIIGIGTTADSFVVFYERIKDEVRDGRTFRSAVPRAWDRAKQTILSGNFVSIIAAVVLYLLAVGNVKGFAFTLGLTTVFDLVILFLVTAPLVILASRRPFFSRPAMNGLAGVMDVARGRRAQGEVLLADDTVHADGTVSAAPEGASTTGKEEK